MWKLLQYLFGLIADCEDRYITIRDSPMSGRGRKVTSSGKSVFFFAQPCLVIISGKVQEEKNRYAPNPMPTAAFPHIENRSFLKKITLTFPNKKLPPPLMSFF